MDEATIQGLLKLEGITINTKNLNWPIYTFSLHNFHSNHPMPDSLDITPKLLLNYHITSNNAIKFKTNSRTFNTFNKTISKQIDWQLTINN